LALLLATVDGVVYGNRRRKPAMLCGIEPDTFPIACITSTDSGISGVGVTVEAARIEVNLFECRASGTRDLLLRLFANMIRLADRSRVLRKSRETFI